MLASLTVSPRPGVGSRSIAFSRKGIAVVQALSSRELATRSLRAMERFGPQKALEEVILKDAKAGYRQAVLASVSGEWSAFTGMGVAPEKGHVSRGQLICAGNGLKRGVLRALCSVREKNPIIAVLSSALRGEEAGGNLWPSRSASLVIVGERALKVDVFSSEDPVFDIMRKIRRLKNFSLLY